MAELKPVMPDCQICKKPLNWDMTKKEADEGRTIAFHAGAFYHSWCIPSALLDTVKLYKTPPGWTGLYVRAGKVIMPDPPVVSPRQQWIVTELEGLDLKDLEE
ncbi:MAG: hypothetical protein M3315_06350 [Actinomycetota bacterium]|nr:hypothetical protein [Actinomycetota bacterium]